MLSARYYIAACLLFLGGAAALAEDYELRGRTMGTTYSLKFAAPAELDVDELHARIARRLAEIDERMSTYRDDSELSRFNATAAGEWFPVSLETAEVVKLAMEIAEETDGAFDPTVGPLVALWRFGVRSGSNDFKPPSDAELEDVMRRIGYRRLEVRLDPPALKKAVAGLQVDLSAIAKGHGVDALAELLADAGASRAMVEVGGEVRTIGGRGDGQPWRIGVEAPVAGKRRLQTVVPIQDESLATSGDYRNFYEYEGKRYSHTIDPRTGLSVEHNLGSATILASRCARADALATAILVMGPQRGLEWANEHQVEALLLVRDGGAIRSLASDTFDRLESSQLTSAASKAKPPQAGYFTILLVAIVVFGIALFGMAIGVVLSNRSIQGSCGGLAGMKDEKGKTLCVACDDPAPDCDGEKASR